MKNRITHETKLVPKRIKEAREYCRLSAVELSDTIDVTRQAVSQFENGTTNPSIEILSRIADATGFPLQFFFKEKRPSCTATSQIPLYRGSPTKTKSLRRSYEIVAEWSSDIVDFLKNYVVLFDVNLPSNLEFDYSCNIDIVHRIEEITDNLRDFWSIGKGPIHDIVGILENNGFIISKIPNKAREVEAFSIWYEKVPHIFYEGNRNTAASYVFSISHELGHLTLHQSLLDTEILDSTLYKTIEDQANIFAGAFLLPAETFGNEYLTSNLDSFIAIKKKWGVSLGAMIMRAHVLGIIDKQQKSYLYKQLSARGYRRHEPYDDKITFNGPAVLYNSVKMIAENKIINMQDFVSEIAIPKDELIAICSLPHDFIEQNLNTPRGVPQLRIVK